MSGNCTWNLNDPNQVNPHTTVPSLAEPKIMESILEKIGNTPLVRCARLEKSENIDCELLAKCEFFNAGGSVKDRIGKRMIEDAEKSGRIKKGDTIIEATSGNTGIGLALAAALKGYRMIITLPEKMSQEKVDVLKALGAEIIRTPTEAAWDSPDSHIGVAKRLNQEIPNSHIMDQYGNPSNALAHYDTTAEELLEQTDGNIDYIILSAGTGGTITGIARKLKERIPHIKVIGVDPHGSILAQPESLNTENLSYKVEGIGYDFIPKNLDRSVIDEWVKTFDKESFLMSRKLIREEGLLAGGSSGAVMSAAVKYCRQKRIPKGKRVVVLLADSVRNYMSKFLNDDWMVENGFIKSLGFEQQWWSTHCVGELNLSTPYTIHPNVSAGDCTKILQKMGYDQLPVVGEDNKIEGVVTMGNLTAKLTRNLVSPEQAVGEGAVLYKQFKKVDLTCTLADLSNIFNKDHFVLVVKTQQQYTGVDDVKEKEVVVGVVTRIDLVNYIINNKPTPLPSSKL